MTPTLRVDICEAYKVNQGLERVSNEPSYCLKVYDEDVTTMIQLDSNSTALGILLTKSRENLGLKVSRILRLYDGNWAVKVLFEYFPVLEEGIIVNGESYSWDQIKDAF